MGVYSNKEILTAIEDGTIVCEPFNSNHVAEASMDVTLGYYYFKLEPNEEEVTFNPFDEVDVKRFFKGPFEAIPHGEWCKQNNQEPFKNVPLDHPIIVVGPNERILAHTHEFIGIRAHGGACSVHSRSSWGRNGVAVCFDAGWVDPGYINRITLEICNLNQHESVVLPVGERIAQFVFYHAGDIEGSYEQGRDGISGKYQTSSDLEELKRDWRPERMLPMAWKDKRVMPAKISGLSADIR